MTFFLHVPELEAGITEARSAMGMIDESQGEEQQAKLVAMLDEMLTFAETNLKSMLQIMGFSSIEQLNEALRNYNNFNLSLQQLFPAFSAPQLSEVLAQSGIGNIANTGADYSLIVSALEDNINKLYQKYMNDNLVNGINAADLRSFINIDELAANTMAQLFGGVDLDATGIIDFGSGKVDFNSIVSKLGNVINKAARERGLTGTSAAKTLLPFYHKVLKPFIENVLNSNFDLFATQKSYQELEQLLRRSQKAGFNQEIIKERIRRGGVTVSTKFKTNASINDTGLQVTNYIDAISINIDPNIFSISNRGKENIEPYVERICKENPGIRQQLLGNIKNFYWNIINSYLPAGVKNPLMKEKFDSLIEEMGAPSPKGNIGWFFSQGTTKAGGAGMFGEIAGMIYMSILCPNLADNVRLIWAGGVTGDAKPPADIVLGMGLKEYGIQVKNYTSGSILSHDYALKIKNIVDEAAENNDNNRLDLMTIQATSELGITEAEIEAVQNVIIANTFNVPYEKINGVFVPGSPEAFKNPRLDLTSAFQQATRYMAVISVIMHRLQYAEEITRQVSSTKEERQLQNTLWLINGSMFVSSVQILQELKNYVLKSVDRFFNISTSVRIKGDKLPDGIQEGNMTIIEYYNYSAKGLGTTALSKVSARIGTNYRMSAFNP